ncbi:MAG: PEP-CTERM sorting domain-containing protein [Akkermansiaceae bacterium]|nr:PEP-CTERM sorting domain-containing protein [Akkermansiaceae bacterium]MCP5542294.1 PEP-CTERM sorting domain-containing protein [Akkermansiaceae bacterium]MCP5546169.1 PEP-CTERM sorting domain-containing protein [Akkermansiaceae bacterium]
MKQKLNQVVRMAACGIAMAGSSAFAANSLFSDGDLIMTFQQAGGSQSVYVNLGSATSYRGDAVGPDGAPVVNIVNVASTLTSTFGANWQTLDNLFVGLSAVRTNTQTPTAVDGDPGRTVYVSNSRSALGNIFEQGSSAKSISGNTAQTTASSGILNMNTPFRNGSDQTIGVFTASESNIDNQMPINIVSGNLFQDTAFGAFPGGIQQQGSAGILGSTSFAGIGDVEFALDLYRIYGDTFGTDPNSLAGPLRQGTFEGTFLLGTDGNISYIPEPSSAALLGLAAGGLLIRRRRIS